MFELQARWFQFMVLVVPTERCKKRGDLRGHHGIHQHTSLKDKSGGITYNMPISRNDTKLSHCERPNIHAISQLYAEHIQQPPRSVYGIV